MKIINNAPQPIKVEIGDVVKMEYGTCMIVEHRHNGNFPYGVLNLATGVIENSYSNMTTFTGKRGCTRMGKVLSVYPKAELHLGGTTE